MIVEGARERILRVDTRAEAVYRLAVGAMLALGVGAIVVAGWSLVRGGIGWDSWFDTGAQLAARSVDSSWSLRTAYDAVPSTSEFYGLFLYQFADLLHLLTTGDTAPLGKNESVTYVYQGAATIIVTTAAITALAVAVAVAYRSVLAGAFAWSLTLTTPLWLGMSHVDFKDMPVVAGLTLVSAGCILAFVVDSPVKAAIVGSLLAGAGGAIALATRAGSLVLLVALASVTAACVVGWGFGSRRIRATVPTVVACVSALVAALAFTWTTNPIARIDTVRWLHDAAAVARDYPWDLGTIRVAGRDVFAADLPWWYVPAWLGAQLPVLTLVALLGGFVVLGVGVVKGWERIDARTAIPLVPLILQGLVFPAGIVASGAVLYDGIRHLLFMIPALIAIASVGVAVLDRRTRAVDTRVRVVLPISLVVVVAASLWASVRWAPYAYAFVNPVAGYDKDGRRWDLDYWGVSGREGIERLKELGYSPVYVEPSSTVGVPYGARGGNPLSEPQRGRPGLYVFLRWKHAAEYGCTRIFTIERDGHVLGEGARCPVGSAAPD